MKAINMSVFFSLLNTLVLLIDFDDFASVLPTINYLTSGFPGTAVER